MSESLMDAEFSHEVWERFKRYPKGRFLQHLDEAETVLAEATKMGLLETNGERHRLTEQGVRWALVLLVAGRDNNTGKVLEAFDLLTRGPNGG